MKKVYKNMKQQNAHAELMRDYSAALDAGFYSKDRAASDKAHADYAKACAGIGIDPNAEYLELGYRADI